MPVSQFTLYASTDSGAPVLSGTSGSLVHVLNKILVTGYGTKAAAGWTADITYNAGSGSTYRPASGSRMFLCVDDTAPFTGKEARIVGMEMPDSSSNLTGSGMFPLRGYQGINTNGYLTARKSTTADTTARAWVAFADAYGLYFFNITGDPGNFYMGELVFGDIYSFKSSADTYRCLLVGRQFENSATAGTLDTITSTMTTTLTGHYMPRVYGGGGWSIAVGKQGDYAKGGGAGNLSGNVAYPNSPNSQSFIAPVHITEPVGNIRGKMRGFYHWCHAASNVADKDTMSGSVEYANRTFYFVKFTANANVYCIETSQTLETN
jgi:hypothetical protein